QLVMRHAIDNAVHRRRRADAEPERHGGDGDHARMPAPETERVAHVGKMHHDSLYARRKGGFHASDERRAGRLISCLMRPHAWRELMRAAAMLVVAAVLVAAPASAQSTGQTPAPPEPIILGPPPP